MQVRSEHHPSIRLMFGGDVMLGRTVKEYIFHFGPGYPLQPIAGLLRQADICIVNLECAITNSITIWPGEPKAFYFGAPPQAVQSLLDAGIDMVSLANNHTLDFGAEGLLDTLQLLRSHGIRTTGAGVDIEEAALPAMIECRGIKFGMAAFCDHQGDFAARENSPGIVYLDLDDESDVIAALHKALDGLQAAAADWPILSLHWGPNMVFQPSTKFRRLAHAAIDMGWKILFGHSAHVFHGIEIYRGCPIIYAAGDLVDDYYVYPEFGNDHQLLFEMELTKDALRRIYLHPIFIEKCQARLADEEQAEYVIARMKILCDEMGTHVQHAGKNSWIEGSDP